MAHISTSTVPAWWLLLLLFLALVLVLNYLGVRIAIGAMLTFAAISFTPMLFLALDDHRQGRGRREHPRRLQPRHDLGARRLQRRDARHPAVRRLRGGRVDRRREPRSPAVDPARAARHGRGVGAVLRHHGLRDLDRPRQKTVEAGGWAFDPAALDKVATQYVGSWFATIIDLVVILDATALALAICVTIGRGYFALGRDGLLPSVFAKTSRHDTPWVGNLVVAVGGLGLMLLGLYSHTLDRFVGPQGLPSREFAAFLVAATAGSFAVELVYLFLAVAAIMLLVRLHGAWWQYLIVVVAIATPILGFYGALNPAPHNSDEPELARALLGARHRRARGDLVRDRPRSCGRRTSQTPRRTRRTTTAWRRWTSRSTTSLCRSSALPSERRCGYQSAAATAELRRASALDPRTSQRRSAETRYVMAPGMTVAGRAQRGERGREVARLLLDP